MRGCGIFAKTTLLEMQLRREASPLKNENCYRLQCYLRDLVERFNG